MIAVLKGTCSHGRNAGFQGPPQISASFLYFWTSYELLMHTWVWRGCCQISWSCLSASGETITNVQPFSSPDLFRCFFVKCITSVHFGPQRSANGCYSQMRWILISSLLQQAWDASQLDSAGLAYVKPWVWSSAPYKVGTVAHSCHPCTQ